MQAIWQDLRYSLRGLANCPSFALLAILNLGLGIATTIFSVIQNVLLDRTGWTGGLLRPRASGDEGGSAHRRARVTRDVTSAERVPVRKVAS